MREKLLAALAAREERIEIGGDAYIVREMETAADAAAFVDEVDITYKMVVRCVFDLEGKQVFTDEDIPSLKKTAKSRFLPIFQAVQRVNGLDVPVVEKNSGAGQPAG